MFLFSFPALAWAARSLATYLIALSQIASLKLITRIVSLSSNSSSTLSYGSVSGKAMGMWWHWHWGKCYLPSFPIDCQIMPGQPIVSKKYTAIFKISDGEVYAFHVIPDLDAYFHKCHDLSWTVFWSVCIIDSNRGHSWPSGDVVFFDKRSADSTTGTAAVD